MAKTKPNIKYCPVLAVVWVTPLSSGLARVFVAITEDIIYSVRSLTDKQTMEKVETLKYTDIALYVCRADYQDV